MATATQSLTTKTRKSAKASAAELDFRPRTFAYVRVSTDEQAATGQSLQVQEQQLRGWAMQHGRTIDEVMVEAGISGGVPLQDRPQGGRLYQMARKGDSIVASKLDRMFRSAGDCLTVVETFRKRGVSLYLLDLNGGADDVSGSGIARLFLTIVGAFAEFERDRIGERIRSTKRRQKAAGEYSGGRVMFGYRVGDGRNLAPVETQQQAIETMRALRAEGRSLRAIADEITAGGVPISHMGVRQALARQA
jgi:DNA invertase Pin-like site-specific DNA recombinase